MVILHSEKSILMPYPPAFSFLFSNEKLSKLQCSRDGIIVVLQKLLFDIFTVESKSSRTCELCTWTCHNIPYLPSNILIIYVRPLKQTTFMQTYLAILLLRLLIVSESEKTSSFSTTDNYFFKQSRLVIFVLDSFEKCLNGTKTEKAYYSNSNETVVSTMSKQTESFRSRFFLNTFDPNITLNLNMTKYVSLSSSFSLTYRIEVCEILCRG